MLEPQKELISLNEALVEISAKAESFGLDFYDIFFEICPSDIIYTFGAYGMPSQKVMMAMRLIEIFTALLAPSKTA
jgi:spore cortex formation protein SpoVR/YcgB (stage V sporulation)